MSISRAAKVKTVVIAAPGLNKEKLQALISEIQPQVKNISFVPDLIGTPMSSVELSLLFSEKILLLNLRNNLSRPYKYSRILHGFAGDNWHVASQRQERYDLSRTCRHGYLVRAQPVGLD